MRIIFNILIFLSFLLCSSGCISKEDTNVATFSSIDLESTVENGEIYLKVSITNNTNKPLWVDKFNFCFDSHLSSDLLKVKAIKNNSVLGDVGYKGVIFDRVDELDPDHFFNIAARSTVNCKFNFRKYYALNDNFDSYEVQYKRLNYSYLDNQAQFILESKVISFPHIQKY